MIRRGAQTLLARADAGEAGREPALELEIEPDRRAFRVDGREVAPREYHGRLEVVVYSTDRLRVVRGSMRERRQFLDRGAAALWPSYRASLREFERVLAQRNAALESRGRDEEVWTERLRRAAARACAQRRAAYAARLNAALGDGLPAGRRELRGGGAGPRRRARTKRAPGSREEIDPAAARAGGGPQPGGPAPRRRRAARRRGGGGGGGVVRAGPQPAAGPGPGQPPRLPRGDRARRRWRCSTTSTRSSTRSERAPCVRRSRTAGRPW